MEKQNRESHCVQGSGIFLVGAGDRRQPYLSPVRCSSGMFSALNEKTGTRSRIGLIQFYYNWEEDKKYLLVESTLQNRNKFSIIGTKIKNSQPKGRSNAAFLRCIS